MTAKEFFDLVAEMRSNQKMFFRTHNNYALEESKRLERLVDAEIKRVEEVIKDKQYPKLNFKESEE